MNRPIAVATALTTMLIGALASLPAAQAGQTCPTQAVVTYEYIGNEQCYIVPAGVDEIEVEAVGAAGGDALPGFQERRRKRGLTEGSPGGAAAAVEATLDVDPGQRLIVVVGGEGGDGSGPDEFGGAGGYNGGGDSFQEFPFGGGGGGASDVRTLTCSGECQAQATLESRLLVAAGGGGGGYQEFANTGTHSGGDGGIPTGGDGLPAGSGGLGATVMGGGGSPGGGQPGVLGQGGDAEIYAGGGGGGLYGGGGGATTPTSESGGGGGGGGSSLVPEDGSVALDTSGPARISIRPVAEEPKARTRDARRVRCRSAVLTGRIDPQGGPARYRFDYGIAGRGLLLSTPKRSAGDGDRDVEVRARVRRLKPGERYAFRVLAFAAGGVTVPGEVLRFRTPRRCG